MSILVVGATGATGRLLVEQLLNEGQSVRAIVRSTQSLAKVVEHPNLTITQASIMEMSDTELEAQVQGCHAIASCLGHNLTFAGIFGRPRRLVTDSARRLCEAVKRSGSSMPVKYVLMNSTGVRNKILKEKVSLAHRMVVTLLRWLPPHADNEDAAAYLQSQHQSGAIEWTAVRPDGLTDEEAVTEYQVVPSPLRDPIFDAGKTSRINVARFMAQLVVSDALWTKWRGRMPVIYNRESCEGLS